MGIAERIGTKLMYPILGNFKYEKQNEFAEKLEGYNIRSAEYAASVTKFILQAGCFYALGKLISSMPEVPSYYEAIGGIAGGIDAAINQASFLRSRVIDEIIDRGDKITEPSYWKMAMIHLGKRSKEEQEKLKENILDYDPKVARKYSNLFYQLSGGFAAFLCFTPPIYNLDPDTKMFGMNGRIFFEHFRVFAGLMYAMLGSIDLTKKKKKGD